MAFVRVKKHGNRKYYYLVEGYREGGKVKQRVLKYFGTRPPRGRQKGLLGSHLDPKTVWNVTHDVTLENSKVEGK